ncbi:MAG: DUF1566 domain-containing protein, partial [Polyangiaceae bacterium]|nr:DUF1566 domain-containing protein [Polyangiaceae bacterium]
AQDPLNNCTPDPSALPTVMADITFDQRTCLVWEFAHKNDTDIADYADENALGLGSYSGSNLDVEAYCEAATTGGFEDWRVPDALELKESLVDCAVGEYYAPIDLTTRLATTDVHEETASEWNPPKLCVHNILNGDTTVVRGGAGVRCVRGTATTSAPSTCMSCL